MGCVAVLLPLGTRELKRRRGDVTSRLEWVQIAHLRAQPYCCYASRDWVPTRRRDGRRRKGDQEPREFKLGRPHFLLVLLNSRSLVLTVFAACFSLSLSIALPISLCVSYSVLLRASFQSLCKPPFGNVVVSDASGGESLDLGCIDPRLLIFATVLLLSWLFPPVSLTFPSSRCVPMCLELSRPPVRVSLATHKLSANALSCHA